MINFIKEIVIGSHSTKGKQVITIAHPTDGNDSNCITVICGKNNTGKTHILREIVRSAYNKPHNVAEHEGINIHAIYLDADCPLPNILHLEDLTGDKNRIQEVPLGKYKHDPSGKKTKYREAIVQFSGRQLSHIVGEKFDLEKWLNDEQYRKQYSSHELKSETIYACDRAEDIVKHFEEATSGRLYLGCHGRGAKKFLQLALYYDAARVFFYPNWSEGQKALFCALLAVDYHKPEILLLDEIENHLHPEYITHLALMLKERVPQTILITHHPHVLFSELVDSLHYIELRTDPLDEAPATYVVPRGFIARSPRRNVKKLETDFQTIEAAFFTIKIGSYSTWPR